MSFLRTIKDKFKEVPKEVLVGTAIAGIAVGAVVAIAANKRMPNAVYASLTSFGKTVSKSTSFVVVNDNGFGYVVDSVKNSNLWHDINISMILGELEDVTVGMIL
jgi:orotate phosphoribosyltransferase